MNIREDIKQLQTGDRDLRKFGLMVGGVFAVLGLLFLWRHKAYYPYFLWPGATLVTLGAALPRMMEIGGSTDRVAAAVPKGDSDYDEALDGE